MTADPKNQPVVRAHREAVIDRLTEGFADDRLTIEQFERRLDRAHRAASVGELDALLADLPTGKAPVVAGSPVPAPRPRARSATLAPEAVPDHRLVLGVWSGATRKGGWIPGRQTTAVAVMGGVEIDLRDAPLGPGVTTINVFAVMGGVEVIVPPDVQVEFAGHGFMGGFDCAPDVTPVTDPSKPTVRITGLAVWGGADVQMRLPGETAREAKVRRRTEKKRRALERKGRSRG